MTDETRVGYRSIAELRDELIESMKEHMQDGKYRGPLEDILACNRCDLYLNEGLTYDAQTGRTSINTALDD